VSVDYPTVVVPWENEPLPICGVAVCGEAVLPIGLWALTIESTTEWKITRKDINFKDRTIVFKIREV